MKQITKRQHNVSAFYLRLWTAPGKNTIACHDLKDKRAFDVSPDGIMTRRYFYEEDPSKPDNRIENLLAEMEGPCSTHFQKLHCLPIASVRPSNEKSLLSMIQNALTDDTCTAIKTFAAFQYLRVPGAIEQKRYELSTTSLSSLQKDYLLNAGRFVESGFSYVNDRFQLLKLLILLSTGQNFITSDWPCFDICNGDQSPLLGEEIGENPDVVAYLPLSPRLAAVLYPVNHLKECHPMAPVFINPSPDSIVRNQNSLVIQQADRFVVADRQESFIFKVASKRKKSRNA